MKRTGRVRRPMLLGILESDKVRRAEVDGKSYYALFDVLEAAGAEEPAELWGRIVKRVPGLAELLETLEFLDAGGAERRDVGVDLEGAMEILQVVPTAKAEAVRRWLAGCGAAELEESADPELAVMRARHEYERRGYPRNWIDQRMRSISARAEVVGEWHKRGASSSEDYRLLTNTLLLEIFGMDVETYRQHKGLFGRENLQDHMSDMELALVTLGETVAATLHRSRGSKAVRELEADTQNAGGIVAQTRKEIEKASGRGVVEGKRKRPGERRNPVEGGGREVAYRREGKEQRAESEG